MKTRIGQTMYFINWDEVKRLVQVLFFGALGFAAGIITGYEIWGG